MIRLIKFCARFDFEIHHPTFEALLSCKGEILKSSSVRIFEELLRMLESGSSKSFFHLLNEYGLLKSLTPTLAVYLEASDNDSLKLLGVIDDEVRKTGSNIDRALLMASLIFPLFKLHIEAKNQAQEKALHLGQITECAHKTIDEIFSPFFKLPRRMRGVMGSILSCQYRFIPVDGRQIRKPRAPKDSSFPKALELLKYRAIVDPELLPQYTLWTEAAFIAHGEGDSLKRKRRRKRRKRPE